MKRQTRAFLLNAATGVAIAMAAALVLLPTVASAAPAVATSYVNVRAQPTTNSPVVNTLSTGESVDVRECRGGWCYVAASGNDGWVSSRYLSNGQQQPGTSFNFGITGPNGNTFQFGIGTPQPNNPPPVIDDEPPPVYHDAEACFYSRSEYRGGTFCVQAGDQIRDLGDWDGDISSIRNSDGLDVTVCTRSSFRGDCRTYTTSSRYLGSFDNEISSIKVD